jgi:hypothetical protein
MSSKAADARSIRLSPRRESNRSRFAFPVGGGNRLCDLNIDQLLNSGGQAID